MSAREPAELSPQNQVKTCRESKGCFISTQLMATSCSVKITTPWPADQHMERQTSATDGFEEHDGPETRALQFDI